MIRKLIKFVLVLLAAFVIWYILMHFGGEPKAGGF